MKEVTTIKIMPNGERQQVQVSIPPENSVDIYINQLFWKSHVCNLEYLEEFILGNLISEGIINACSQLMEYIFIPEQARVNVVLAESAYSRFVTKKALELTSLPPSYYEEKWIFQMANTFVNGGIIHQKTKGAHSCIVAIAGKIVFSCEDIGRHNAMDKAIGYIYKNQLIPTDCILFTTGRIPTEMAIKAIRAGIPILATKAVPTDKALELAQKYKLQLLCKAWPDSFEVFS